MPVKLLGTWDKVCVAFAILIGAIMLSLGAVGVILGCNFHFKLPPVLGALPFLAGWAMTVVLVRYWRLSKALSFAGATICPTCRHVMYVPADGMGRCSNCGRGLQTVAKEDEYERGGADSQTNHFGE